MSPAPTNFQEALGQYLKDAAQANSEASKAYLFLEFSRGVFKEINADYLEKLFPVLEKHLRGTAKTVVVTGRIDAFLGNLVIEFKKVLDGKSLKEAESELRRYISVLWTEQKPSARVPYIAIATDGIHFVSYRPRTSPEEEEVTPDEVELDPIDRLDLSKTRPGAAFIWLDRYMLTTAFQPATSEAFSNQFGLNRPGFKDAEAFLVEAWKNHREKVLYEQWANLLRIVYGSRVDSEDLFIRHTYLAMLAKLLAYSSFSGGALPVSPEQITEILEGKVFEKWNVHNFLEEDFFSWVARSDEGIKATSVLLERLAAYDLSTIDEDILKSLYQELVDPQARHDLGEYYTPDWLAELMVEKTLSEDADKTVLDPACGSGTFLAATIRRKKQLLRKRRPNERLQLILDTVKGVDVHPLAIILSQTNYLASLGTELLSARRGPISVPVYMADSIRLPESDITLYAGVKSFKIDAEGRILRLPLDLAKDPSLTDRVLETVKEYASTIPQGNNPELEDFENLLSQKIGPHKITSNEASILLDTAKTMAELVELKKDTVWAFILKNIYKPLFLRDQKFDIVIGNPPWLLYRYVESVDYQAFLKDLIMNDYGLLGLNRAEVITEMEIATLFFARASDLYLAKEGRMSFVMPRGIFVSDQHHDFRRGTFTPKMAFEEFLDLEDVEPLFRVPSCVVTAKRGTNHYPINTVVFKGKLPQKNSKLSEAVKTLVQTRAKYQYYEIGQRSFLASLDFEKVLKEIEKGHRSLYYESFTQGATIVPRPVWFVDPVAHPKLGIDPTKPGLRTSERAIHNAKEEYANVELKGEVESEFIYRVVTGSELAPFCTTTLPIVVLPIEPSGSSYRIIKSDEAQRRGYSGLRSWLVECERVWKERRGEKAERIDLYSWLDYQNKLTGQSSRMKYRVVYNTSGTYLVSCVLRNGESTVSVDSSQFRVSGVIADMTTCRFDTNDHDEALFVSAILNAPIIDSLIKPMQSRGQFGARHIAKKVLELPLPIFNPSARSHMELVSLGKLAQIKAENLVVELEPKYSGIGTIRHLIKAEISEEVLKIDRIVRSLLSEVGNLPKGLDDFTEKR